MNRTKKIIAKAFIVIIKLVGNLPFSFNRKIGYLVGLIIRITNSRMYCTTKTNIDICYPNLSSQDKKKLIKKACHNIGLNFAEMTWFWQRDIESLNKRVTTVKGIELFEEYKKKNKGVVVVGLHLGNWELLFNWLPQYTDLAIMHRGISLKELADYVIEKRSRTGATMLEGRRENVARMREQLHNGDVLLTLHDQEPLAGSGLFSTFYGVPVYTMLTAMKLAKKTGAEVVLATFVRNKEGYEANFERVELDFQNLELQALADEFNRLFEQQINKCPEQYQWSYKRFKSTVDGSPNPYIK